jgi:CHAD domain-containing protein
MDPTRVRNGESGAADILNTLRRQTEEALITLAKNTPITDENIHQTRKLLKRARTSLRLLRDAVGKTAYSRENVRLRDAARYLALVRDTQAALDTLASLPALEKFPARRTLFRELTARLMKSRADLHCALQDGKVLEQVTRLIGDARQDIDRWQVAGADTGIVRNGLKRIYRRGRNALSTALTDCSDENLHELRKQAKFLGQALEIFQPAETGHLAKSVTFAQSIADCLGDDHDLTIVRDAIIAVDRDTPKNDAELLDYIERRRRKLQRNALQLSRQLYAGKAKDHIA